MDDTRPNPIPTGNVESTPEAGPLTPPTMRDHFNDPLAVPGERPAAAAQAGTSSTPEAVVTSASSASTGATEQPTASSGQPATGAGSGGASDDRSTIASGGPPREELDPEAIAKDVATRLKPVVEAAEDVATKALDLSAKGLSKLVDMLEERRSHRESSKPADPTNPS